MPETLENGRWTGRVNFQHFKTGEDIPVWYDNFRIDDPETGEPVSMGTVTRDLSELEKLNKELTTSRKRFETLFKHIPVPTLTWQFKNGSFNLKDYNKAAVHFTKENVDVLYGIELHDFYDQPVAKKFARMVEKSYKEKGAISFQGEFKFNKEEKSKCLDVKMVFVEPDLVMVHTEDITQKIETEQALKKSEYQLRTIINSVPALISYIDNNQVYQFVNEYYAKIFGQSVKEIEGSSVKELMGPNYKKANRLNKKALSGHRVQDLVELEQNGDKTVLRAELIPDYNENDEVTGYFAIAVDITDLKNYEKKLQQKINEKEVLLQEVHHRVKNNLQLVTGLLKMQINRTTDEVTKTHLLESHTRIKSIALIYEEIYKHQNLEKINLNKYIKNLGHNLVRMYNTANIEIVVSTADEPVEIDADKAIPVGLITNELVGNAFKHAFSGRDSGNVTISVHNHHQTVSLSVKDNGIGISKSDVDNKLSLGWKLVKKLIRQLKGTWTIDNKNGTNIKIFFDI